MRILELHHGEPEFAYNNEGFFRRRGDEIRRLFLSAGEEAPDPLAQDAVIVYGGYMSAFDDAGNPWIAGELRFLEACLKDDVPILGICLGSQLLARLLGARVYRSDRPEFGFTRIALTEEGQSCPALAAPAAGRATRDFLGLEWHDDAWDLPAGARRLAESACWPNEAFSYGDKVLAIQFHLEFSYEHMAWAMREKADEVPRFPGAQTPAEFLADRGRFGEIAANMEKLLGAFLPE
jgi:GMP synthase (glutamine-hydrolysing)